jgi:hypothetical protein
LKPKQLACPQSSLPPHCENKQTGQVFSENLPRLVKGLNEDGAAIGGADVGKAFENDWDTIIINLQHQKAS